MSGKGDIGNKAAIVILPKDGETAINSLVDHWQPKSLLKD